MKGTHQDLCFCSKVHTNSRHDPELSFSTRSTVAKENLVTSGFITGEHNTLYTSSVCVSCCCHGMCSTKCKRTLKVIGVLPQVDLLSTLLVCTPGVLELIYFKVYFVLMLLVKVYIHCRMCSRDAACSLHRWRWHG